MQNKSKIHIPLSKYSLESGIQKSMQTKSKIRIPLSKYSLESGIQKRMQTKSKIRIPLSKYSLESGIQKRMQTKSKIHIPLSKYSLESGIQKRMQNKSKIHVVRVLCWDNYIFPFFFVFVCFQRMFMHTRRFSLKEVFHACEDLVGPRSGNFEVLDFDAFYDRSRAARAPHKPE